MRGKIGSLHTWTTDPTPPAGLAPAASVTGGKLNLSGWQRIRGQAEQDQAGAHVVDFRITGAGAVVMTYTIPQDLAQPNFVYSYDIIMLAPYVEITFTNGGVPSTFFRAHNAAFAT